MVLLLQIQARNCKLYFQILDLKSERKTKNDKLEMINFCNYWQCPSGDSVAVPHGRQVRQAERQLRQQMLLVRRDPFERMSAGTKRKREEGEEFWGRNRENLNKSQRHAMQENKCQHRPERRSKEPSRGGGWSVRFHNLLLKSGRELG